MSDLVVKENTTSTTCLVYEIFKKRLSFKNFMRWKPISM